MDNAGPAAENGAGTTPSVPPATHAAVNTLSVLGFFQTWSNDALNALNSIAAIVGLVAAALLVGALAILYLSGHELTGRAAQVTRPPETGTAQASVGPTAQSNGHTETRAERRQMARLTKELTEARSSAESKKTDLAKATAELDRIQKSNKAKTERVAKLENDVAAIRRAEEEKSSRVAQLEGQLAELRRTDDEKTTRLSQMQKDLEGAQKTSQQALASWVAPTRAPEAGRELSENQRTAFMQAVKGLPTGKVIISAFFENRETHEFGRSVLKLLRDAGFSVIEQAPVNFFTTSRPSSGLRIGCEDMAHPPPHFATLRKGFEAMGIEISDSSVVNADAADIVEIQITPKD